MNEPKPDLYVKDINGNYHRYEQEQGEPVVWRDLTNNEMFGLCRDIQSGKHSAYDILWEVSTRLKARNTTPQAPQAKPAVPETPEDIEKASAEHYGCTVEEYREFKAWYKAKFEAAPQGRDK